MESHSRRFQAKKIIVCAILSIPTQSQQCTCCCERVILWDLPALSKGRGEVRIEGEAVRSSIIPGIVVPKKASVSSGSNTSSKRWCRPSKLQSYLSLYLVLYDMIACSSSLLEVIGAEVRALITSCHLGERIKLGVNHGTKIGTCLPALSSPPAPAGRGSPCSTAAAHARCPTYHGAPLGEVME